MYSWFATEIQALSQSDYRVTYLVATLFMGYLTYLSYAAFKRFRFIDGTATSKIRSAAQGHVELKGLGEWLPNGAILSPFSQSRCIWYHCTIEKKQRRGKRTTWTHILDERSPHLFRLVDESGECVVDPEHAHVIVESKLTWYGNSQDACHRPPGSSAWVGLGNYRFCERLIRPATSLYALGWFSTSHSTASDELIDKRVNDLIKQWKLQPQRYLAQFDLDEDGKIQQSEWKAVYAAAREQVLAKINAEHRTHHLMSRPQNTRQPYILSATDEMTLVSRKKIKAYGSVVGAFALFSLLILMASIRSPWPMA